MIKNYNPSIKIGSRTIGIDYPTYFIAEIGSNFDGNLDKAKYLIELAKNAGADAAKFQHYTAESLVSDHGFSKLGSNGSHQSQWEGSVFDVYKSASLNADWTAELVKICNEFEIDFLTSPYSLFLVDFVNEFVPAYKVGSGDITWHEIIMKMAEKGKPLILATGASDISEVISAINAAKASPGIVLMQCNTNYTADQQNYKYLNLNVLKNYALQFPDCILGLSDHMIGHVEVLGAVSLGARVIEKHFTDSNDNDGPDHKFALNPTAFRSMVQDVRFLEEALGSAFKKIEINEMETAVVQRRAVRAAVELKKGDLITKDTLEMLRPCPEDSIKPYEYEKLIGKKIKSNLNKGEALKKSEYFDEY